MAIPGNYFDAETGEALRPVYKFQDAMGIWHEKEVALCTWSELHDGYINIWNYQMSLCVQSDNYVKNEVTWLDMLKIMCYVWTASSLLIAIIILIAMFVK